MLASDIMQPDVISVPTTMDLRDLAKLLLEKGITGAPVVDEHGDLAGVISQRLLPRQGGVMGDSGAYVEELTSVYPESLADLMLARIVWDFATFPSSTSSDVAQSQISKQRLQMGSRLLMDQGALQQAAAEFLLQYFSDEKDLEFQQQVAQYALKHFSFFNINRALPPALLEQQRRWLHK